MIGKKGAFTLIELMVTLLIASFLIMTLNMILEQTGRARQFVDIAVGNALLRTTLVEELGYDFSGMIVFKTIQEKEKKVEQQPPIQMKRSSDGMIEEFSLLTTNARAYKLPHKIMSVRYTLTLVDKKRKLYKITRLLSDRTKKEKEEVYEVPFLGNIVSLDIAFVQKKKQSAEKKEPAFELLKEWPVKQTTKGDQKSGEQSGQQKSEEKKEDILYVQITLGYVKNRRGSLEVFTLWFPLYNRAEAPDIIVSQPQTEKEGETITKETKNEEGSDELSKTSPFSKNKMHKAMTQEELVILEDRTTKMINSLFRIPQI